MIDFKFFQLKNNLMHAMIKHLCAHYFSANTFASELFVLLVLVLQLILLQPINQSLIHSLIYLFRFYQKVLEKMKVTVVLFCLLITTLIHSEAFIYVRIDPDDLDLVGDFFETIIANRGPETTIQSPVRRLILSFAKKAIIGTWDNTSM